MMTSADILMKIQTRFIREESMYLFWSRRCNLDPAEMTIRIRNNYTHRASILLSLVEELFSPEDVHEMLETAWKRAEEM